MDEEKTPLLSTTKVQITESEPYSNLHSGSYGTRGTLVATVAQDQRIIYTWNDLNVFATVHQKRSLRKIFSQSNQQRRHILRNASGVAYPGELLAILGSSGSGKTTLLNALTFRSTNGTVVAGLRCANGIPLSNTVLTSQSAYVQQEDLFFSNLTVREHLIFHAMVRMDGNIPLKQRIKRVDEVISELSLTKCQDTRIGHPSEGISGGERKRLAFAAEVLTNPSLMFCDEPTSGLDSFMALNVVQVLKNMAKSGKTVIATIHQPSSELFAMFDKILLMAEGRIAFQGSPQEAKDFFNSLNAPCPNNYNPADYFIQLLAVDPGEEESCKQAINMICNNFTKSEFGKTVQEAASSIAKTEQSYNDFWTGSDISICPYKASCWMQLRAVMWRSWISVLKEPMLIRIRILQTIMVALVIGIIYFGQELTKNGVTNINGAIFIFLTSMTFQNIYAVVNVFCTDNPVFLREHHNGMYRTDIYFLCRTAAEFPLFTLIPIIYVSICYYMIGLNPDIQRFFIAIGIVILVAHVATSFGYMVSCIATTTSFALAVGPPLIIPFLLFGGFFLNVNSIPFYFKWLSYFSWFRFANEALLINQWSGVEDIDCTAAPPSTCPKNGEIVLEIFSFSKDHFYADIAMLIILIFVFRLMAFSALLCRTFKTS